MEKRHFFLIVVIIIILSALVLRLRSLVKSQAELGNEEYSRVAATSTIPSSTPELSSSTPQLASSSDNIIEKKEVSKDKAVELISPQPGEILHSPYDVSGRALGTWFFEGDLPISLEVDGKVISTVPAQAQSDWMTSDWVNFKAQLKFDVATSTKANLIIKKDNPSGLPENDSEIVYPVILEP